jgi:iron complex transport system ATP-binding protein
MEATGTLALEDRRFDTLSGGEQQRVAIASALAQAPDVLLLDEPTSSLDLAYQLEIGALVTRLNRERGATIVLSTHDLNFAASVCHALVLLRGGRVAAAGRTDEALTPATIREVYGVEADVWRHEGAGHLTVVPVRHAGGAPR